MPIPVDHNTTADNTITMTYAAGPNLTNAVLTGRPIAAYGPYIVYAFTPPAEWVAARWTKPVITGTYSKPKPPTKETS